MSVVTQISVTLENRKGALAELCSELARVAVNISAIYAEEESKATGLVRLIVGQPETARRVLASLKLKFTEEDVLAVKVGDRPGALGKLTRKMAEKGINIHYAYGSIARGSSQALIILSVSDVAAAARVAK